MPKLPIASIPLATALTLALVPVQAESDRHITYVQQHNELLELDSEDMQEVQEAAQRKPRREFFDQGVAIGKLTAALALNERLADFNIEPQLIQGKVILTGSVDMQAHKQLAQDIALAIKGIEQVDNRIRIEEGYEDSAKGRSATRANDFKQKIDDATTAASVKAALSAHPDLQEQDVKVEAGPHGIILAGAVQTQQQKDRAETIAQRHARAKNLQNRISVNLDQPH